ncbi:MAG: hypothetical protein CVV13_10800 [Gammaproteobacteria bacterium HGW-Gammaproteobacteria-3]|nr:MAG: hypothetical protein CVV13_10800 [Gammaproteobacteria bacterium HGW-Gammaproteobacteria-3]
MTGLPKQKRLFFDLTDTHLIDHTVMAFIDHFAEDYARLGGQCEIGLDEHKGFSSHPVAARSK